MSFPERSYQSHSKHYDQYKDGASAETQGKTWLDTETVDAWRHGRMYSCIDPVLKTEQGSRWLTVGDGRYGTDANYIKRHDGIAVASDISSVLLEKAKAAGFIDEFSRENAEALSFAENSFDYVLCKEAYHHFPRPMVALYEMLRVAKQGVVLIEPNDIDMTEGMLSSVYQSLKRIKSRLLRRPSDRNVFESSGNYAYRLSRREVEKASIGLDIPTLAFKSLNDAYTAGGEFEKLNVNGPVYRKMKRKIAQLDMLCACGITDGNVLVAFIFKVPPSQQLRSSLTDAHYKIVDLPRNPYIG